ncbi:hypothetical protein Tco_0434197, partial [Tanacetum coccineum]
MPRECLKIIESKSKVRQTRAKAVIAKVSTNSSTQAVSSDVADVTPPNWVAAEYGSGACYFMDQQHKR